MSHLVSPDAAIQRNDHEIHHFHSSIPAVEFHIKCTGQREIAVVLKVCYFPKRTTSAVSSIVSIF